MELTKPKRKRTTNTITISGISTKVVKVIVKEKQKRYIEPKSLVYPTKKTPIAKYRRIEVGEFIPLRNLQSPNNHELSILEKPQSILYQKGNRGLLTY